MRFPSPQPVSSSGAWLTPAGPAALPSCAERWCSQIHMGTVWSCLSENLAENLLRYTVHMIASGRDPHVHMHPEGLHNECLHNKLLHMPAKCGAPATALCMLWMFSLSRYCACTAGQRSLRTHLCSAERYSAQVQLLPPIILSHSRALCCTWLCLPTLAVSDGCQADNSDCKGNRL